MKWLRKYVEAITADTYTYIGLGIAYFTLDGSAKKVTGLLIISGVTVWLVTLPLREKDDDTPES
jgi:hypothetical protein